MGDTRPIVDFLRVSGSYGYHIVERGKMKALCGFEPLPHSRSRWMGRYDGSGERPYYARICSKCAKKANISPDISPDDAIVRYGHSL